jgi:hypothetical protein
MATRNNKLKSRKGQVRAPVAVTRRIANARPRVTNSANGSIIVCHREFVKDVDPTAVNAFKVESLSINPGLAQLFPWLSLVAVNYESYKFRKFHIEFHPSVATSTAGVLMLAVDYDALDAAPSSKTAMMANFRAVRSSAWAECEYYSVPSELSKFGGRSLYIRSGAVANTDLKTYDLGNVLVATSDNGGAVGFGEIYVDYEVELLTPQYGLKPFTLSHSARVRANTSISKTVPFGTAPEVTGGVVKEAFSSGFTLYGPGEYMLCLRVTGTTVIAAVLELDTEGTIDSIRSNINGAATVEDSVWRVNSLNPVGLVTIDVTGNASVSNTELQVSLYAYQLN